MDPPSQSAGSCEPDIGPILAVVGTKGWRCSICRTTFQRSISIEHHMITSHHPLPDYILSPSCNVSTSSVDVCRDQEASSSGMLSDLSNSSDVVEERYSQKQSKRTVSDTLTEGGNVLGQSSSPAFEKVPENFGNANIADDCERNGSIQGGLGKIQAGEHSACSLQLESAARLETEDAERMEDDGPSECFSTALDTPIAGHAVESGIKDVSGQNTSNNPEAEIPIVQHDLRIPSSLTEGSQLNIVSDSTGAGCHIAKRRHGFQVAASGKPYRRQMCSCGKIFENKQDFRHHRRVVHSGSHLKIFICPICSAQYMYKRGLNRHLREKGSVPFVCSECKQQFHDQLSVDEHRKSCNHNSQSVVGGPPVSQSPSSLSDYKDHKDVVHPQVTPETVCNNSLNSYHFKVNLEGSHQWECSKCHAHFLEKGNFRAHLKECGILRFTGSQRSFHCNLCNATFPFLLPFYKHYLNDHKLEEATNCSASYSPFTGNSPVPSPAPSVTSEINMAMADVDLNQPSAPNSLNSVTEIIDLTNETTTNTGLGEQDRVNDSCGTGGNSNSQSLTIAPSTNTTESSAKTSSSEQASSMEIINLSDVEDEQDSDSSSESDDFESKKGRWGTRAAAFQLQGKQPTFLGHHHPGPSFLPPHSWRPPPPLPPPPPPSTGVSPDGHLRAPFLRASHPRDHHNDHDHVWHHHERGWHHHDRHHRHHDRNSHHRHHGGHHSHHHDRHEDHHGHGHRFMRGMGFLLRGMHFPRQKHPFVRFGFPDWFQQSNNSGNGMSSSEKSQPSNSETEAPTTHTNPSPTASAKADQQTERSEAETSSYERNSKECSDSAPFHHTGPWCKPGMGWKDMKTAKIMMKTVVQSFLLSRAQGKVILVCPECQEMFSKPSDLVKHCSENHPFPCQYTCFICDQTCSDALSFNTHIKQHCEMFADKAKQGYRHGQEQGQWGKGFKGMKCIFKMFGKFGGFGFPAQSSGHQSQDSDKDNNAEEDVSLEEVRECPVCQKKFRAHSREDFFQRHVNSHFGVDVYKFECEVCGKKFLEKGKYTAHLAIHRDSPMHVCPHCGNSYHNKTSLTRHLMIHTGERPHKCTECGEGFIELRELDRHRMKHTGQYPFQCQECQKGFTLKASLLTHMRKKHPQQNTFICSICSERFSSSLGLNQHQKVCVKPWENEVDDGGGNLAVKQEPSSMELSEDCY